MSWGTELWDQYDNLAAHTHKGIDFLDKYGSFVRDRCAIEVEYATKLRRLVKNYQPKKKDEEDFEFTSWLAFRNVLKEIGDLAGQREVVAESLQSAVFNAITLLSKTLRDDRKKALSDGTNLTQNLAAQVAALDRAKRAYEKAYRDSEKALDNYQRADADLNLSRAEVEKQRNNMTIKSQQSDDAKNEYANQLQKTNKLQQSHYEKSLPEVFNRLQEIDEKRTRALKEFIRGAADAEMTVAPIIDRCLEGVSKAADSINEKEDSHKVIERFASGFKIPDDFPFEDLSRTSGDTIDSHASLIPTHKTTTLNMAKQKKRIGLLGIFGSNKNTLSTDLKEDFSELPPTQRLKKLTIKIQELNQKIGQETAARDGLMKMKGVYEANCQLGDPMTVEGQLNESEHKLEKLKAELKKFQAYLEQATKVQQQAAAQHSPQSNRSVHNGQRNSRHSNASGENDDDGGSGVGGGVVGGGVDGGGSIGGDHPNNDHHHNHAPQPPQQHPPPQHDDAGSLSRSASESSVAQAHIENGLNINHNGSSASPESGLGTSHTSLPGSGPGSANEQHNEDMYYEAEPDPLQPLFMCKALYPFDAKSEGSIPMNENEELQVIEQDQGDGWTRVRRHRTDGEWEEGFVPTTYIEILEITAYA